METMIIMGTDIIMIMEMIIMGTDIIMIMGMITTMMMTLKILSQMKVKFSTAMEATNASTTSTPPKTE